MGDSAPEDEPGQLPKEIAAMGRRFAAGKQMSEMEMAVLQAALGHQKSVMEGKIEKKLEGLRSSLDAKITVTWS